MIIIWHNVECATPFLDAILENTQTTDCCNLNHHMRSWITLAPLLSQEDSSNSGGNSAFFHYEHWILRIVGKIYSLILLPTPVFIKFWANTYFNEAVPLKLKVAGPFI